MKKIVMLLAALLLLAALTACSKSGSSGSETKVSMKDMAFSPTTLEISKGSTVTWVNDDAADHSVADKAGSFKSEDLEGGKSYSHKFDKAGTYHVVCNVAGHEAAGMVMDVKVK